MGCFLFNSLKKCLYISIVCVYVLEYSKSDTPRSEDDDASYVDEVIFALYFARGF